MTGEEPGEADIDSAYTRTGDDTVVEAWVEGPPACVACVRDCARARTCLWGADVCVCSRRADLSLTFSPLLFTAFHSPFHCPVNDLRLRCASSLLLSHSLWSCSPHSLLSALYLSHSLARLSALSRASVLALSPCGLCAAAAAAVEGAAVESSAAAAVARQGGAGRGRG